MYYKYYKYYEYYEYYEYSIYTIIIIISIFKKLIFDFITMKYIYIKIILFIIITIILFCIYRKINIKMDIEDLGNKKKIINNYEDSIKW